MAADDPEFVVDDHQPLHPDRPSAQTRTEKEHSSLHSAVNGQGRFILGEDEFIRGDNRQN